MVVKVRYNSPAPLQLFAKLLKHHVQDILTDMKPMLAQRCRQGQAVRAEVQQGPPGHEMQYKLSFFRKVEAQWQHASSCTCTPRTSV